MDHKTASFTKCTFLVSQIIKRGRMVWGTKAFTHTGGPKGLMCLPGEIVEGRLKKGFMAAQIKME